MILSFPIGAYIVFNTDIGRDINYEYPLEGLDFFVVGINVEIPIGFELGDAFIVLWCVYVVIFAIAIFGSKKSFFGELVPIMNDGKYRDANYMVSAIRWFAVLVLVSAIINIAQESVGIITEPPIAQNDLIQFFDITKAPIIEELGFRVLLIGVILYLAYSHKTSARHFFKSLWHPHKNLHIFNNKKAILLIIAVSILFGLAHIISGEPWSNGKFAQAAAGGIIIGWVYFRHGFVAALLIHWATNYFIFSYVHLVSSINMVSIDVAFSHSMLQTFEIIFIIAGIISAALMIIHKIDSKRQKALEA